jgi:hypothetical protein
MSESSLSKSSIGSDRIEVKSNRTVRYYLGLVATLVSLGVGTHAATATTYSPSEATTVPNGTLHAQTTTGQSQMGGRTGRTKKNAMSRSKMRNRMSRANKNGMGRSTMRSNTNSSMRTGKN